MLVSIFHSSSFFAFKTLLSFTSVTQSVGLGGGQMSLGLYVIQLLVLRVFHMNVFSRICSEQRPGKDMKTCGLSA